MLAQGKFFHAPQNLSVYINKLQTPAGVQGKYDSVVFHTVPLILILISDTSRLGVHVDFFPGFGFLLFLVTVA